MNFNASNQISVTIYYNLVTYVLYQLDNRNKFFLKYILVKYVSTFDIWTGGLRSPYSYLHNSLCLSQVKKPSLS